MIYDDELTTDKFDFRCIKKNNYDYRRAKKIAQELSKKAFELLADIENKGLEKQ